MKSRFRIWALFIVVLLAAPQRGLAGPDFSDFDVIADVAYGDSVWQTMDIYLPPKPAGSGAAGPPVILMVHGGAWVAGDKRTESVVANKAAHWLDRGYVFISANTRLVPEADPIEQAGDVARALAAAQSMADVWGGRPDRFVLMGHSSGGHLVSLLAADPALAAAQGAGPWLGTISLDAGAYDVVEIMGRGHADVFDVAFGADPTFWTAASPIHRITAQPAPMLLVCSSLGGRSCGQAAAFAAAVEKYGGSADVLPVKRRHMAIDNDLGLPGAYTDGVDGFLNALGLP
ncbi:alpha/beta hydrolase [Microbaculum sp. FT89]|uniref:alpha/beta hydrolase n=1 Tax=Microbaculum sp. FT89 TaxID=3447298 RepID=UPI003F536BBF